MSGIEFDSPIVLPGGVRVAPLAAVRFQEALDSWTIALPGVANTWTDVHTLGSAYARPGDVIIPNAVEGSSVVLTLDTWLNAAAGGVFLDWWTVVNGAAVNKVVPVLTASGPSSLVLGNNASGAIRGTVYYTVRANDIEDGCVRLRLRAVGGASVSRTLLAGSGFAHLLSAIGPAGAEQVIFDGQSLMYAPAAPGTPARGFPHRVMAQLTPRTWTLNGRSGTTYAGRSGTIGNRIDAQISTANPILVDVAGQSDIQANLSGADLLTAVESYISARRTAGFDKVVTSTIPHMTGLTGPQETARTDYNTLILASSAPDAVADLAAQPELQDAADTTYFYDGLHPTAAGAQVIADEIVAALATIGVT